MKYNMSKKMFDTIKMIPFQKIFSNFYLKKLLKKYSCFLNNKKIKLIEDYSIHKYSFIR